jgi:hypothetical protein
MANTNNLFNDLSQIDLKNRTHYDTQADDEKKKFSPYPLMRWASAIESVSPSLPKNLTADIQQYYICAINEVANKHFFSMGNHPKLQWLMLTAASPKMGKHRHEWIAFSARKSKNKRADIIAKLHPEYKLDDCELMADSIPDVEFKAMLVELGWNDKEIKEALK